MESEHTWNSRVGRATGGKPRHGGAENLPLI